MTRLCSVVLMALLAGPVVTTTMNAQVVLPHPPGSWHFDFTPVVWFAGLKGVAKAGGTTVRLEETFGVEGTAQWGGRFEVNKNWLVLWVDGSFLSTDAKGTTSVDNDSSTTDLRQGVVELAGAYRAASTSYAIDFVLGARFTDLSAITRVPGEPESEGGENWVDAFAGVRFNWGLGRSDRVPLHLSGDVGRGGSSVVWKVTATAGYRFTDNFAAFGGWRRLEIDYNQGTGNDQLIWDVDQNGLIIGLTLGF